MFVGGPWSCSQASRAARPGLSTKAGQSVLGCCCCCVQHRGRAAVSAQCLSVHQLCQAELACGCPGALLRMLRERTGSLSLQSWASFACLCCFCCLSSPAQSLILAPQSNCHTVNLLSPLLQLGSATEWMDYFQKSIGIWEHISFRCAGSWVEITLTPRWLPILLNSVLIQPLPLQPFRTSVSSSRSLLVLMSCVFAISLFVPLLWLSFPI